MLLDDIKLTYNDISIKPAVITEIRHRNECNVFLKNGKMPIFTAPMSTVINEENFDVFEKNGINAILPRNINIDTRLDYAVNGKWVAFSLSEFEQYFTDPTVLELIEIKDKIRVLIDVANGHMKSIFEMVEKSKEIYGDTIEIMMGNIANPKVYEDAYHSGVDYIRVGIGGGKGCLTSSNTSIHFPMASLIYETFQEKHKIEQFEGVEREKLPKIIADGGIRGFRDVIKALALGADYVMIGSVLSSCLDSSGNTFYYTKMKDMCYIDQFDEKWTMEHGQILCNGEKFTFPLYKIFYGMASKKGQEDINGKATKTSEGVEKILEVTHTIASWCDNMKSYFASAMSYTNIKEISEFNPFNIETIRVSKNAFEAVNK